MSGKELQSTAGSDGSRAYVWLFRWGPWLVIAVGCALAVYGLATSGDAGVRITAITLGTFMILAGVALPRIIGEIALDAKGFKANVQGIDQLDPSALAAAVTEAAEKAIPDSYPHKEEFVRELAAKTVQTWGGPEALAGRWWAQLAANGDEPEKLDLVEMQVSGEDLIADIRRCNPEEQSERRWKFAGKVRGSFLFGMFYTTTPDINALSYGTIQLRREDPAATVWSGFYVRLEVKSGGDAWSSALEPVELSWQRLEPNYVAPAGEGA